MALKNASFKNYKILGKPVITEKSAFVGSDSKLVMLVDINANKDEIREAFEAIFGVEVSKVNTLIRSGRLKRGKFGYGCTKRTKRAYITVKGDVSSIFDKVTA